MPRFICMTSLSVNAKLALILLFCLCVNICLNVRPSPTVMRSEPLVKHFQMQIMDILILMVLSLCPIIFILFEIDLNIRYIPFNMRLNTLTTSKKAKCHTNLYFYLLLLVYVMIYEYFFIAFLPFDIFSTHLGIRRITKKSVLLAKIFHDIIVGVTFGACYKIMYLSFFNIACFSHYPFETLAVWISLIRIALCPDIHPNPGPDHTNTFAGGFLSFCNWNLNTLSKDDFYRITLLQAHNTEHNYDIISLCETSLDNNVQVPEMPEYKFHSCNHPDGNRNGGVGIITT